MNTSFFTTRSGFFFAVASLAIATTAPCLASPIEPATQLAQRQSAQQATSETLQLSQNALTSFGDISEDFWARDFIAQLAEKDIIAGFPDGRFRPNEPVTRAQFAAMISKAFKKNKVRNAITLRDISTNYWAYSAIQEAYEMGFLGAISGNQFNPTQRLTRLDILTALTSGLDYSFSGSSETVLEAFGDRAGIPRNARNVIAAAAQRGLIVNYPNVNSLNLNRVATRAEVAAFIYQALVSTGEATAISSPYVVGLTQTTSGQSQITTNETQTNTEVTTNETQTNTEVTSNETQTNTEVTTNQGSSQTEATSTSVVTLTNGYRVTYLGFTNNSGGTSTWRYRVEELPSAQDLSNWVLGLPSCVSVAGASPKGEVVNPDPNAKISGIKWQPGGGFTDGEFTVTLNRQVAVGEIDVAVKGPDVALGRLPGPSCNSL
ncbi:MAG: S-layer homology domain-containing protein [Cyanobacteriota bacterium]